jgi:hypothetical protein
MPSEKLEIVAKRDFSKKGCATFTNALKELDKSLDINVEENYYSLGDFIRPILSYTIVAADSYFDTNHTLFAGKSADELREAMYKLKLKGNTQKKKGTPEYTIDDKSNISIGDIFRLTEEYIEKIPDSIKKSALKKTYESFNARTFGALERELGIGETRYGFLDAVKIKYESLYPYFRFSRELEFSKSKVSKLKEIVGLLLFQILDDYQDRRDDLKYNNVNLWNGLMNSLHIYQKPF